AITSLLASPQKIRQIHVVALRPKARRQFGLWLSLVERSPRVRKVAGSNPVSPINPRNPAAALSVSLPARVFMNQAVLTTIALTGFSVAFFHAAIPTHWLPFVLTSRVQKWNAAKTIAVTALAGTGHVIVTAALGLAITLFGAAISDR